MQIENGMERGMLPEWMRDEMATQVSGDEQSGINLMLGTMTPHGDVMNFVDPTREYSSALSPYIRFPLELQSGKSLFTGTDIKRYPGEPGWKAYLREYIRPVKEYHRIFKDYGSNRPLAYKIVRTLIGGRAQYYDEEQAISRIAVETNQEMLEIRKALRSRYVTDTPTRQKLARRYMELLAVRARLNIERGNKAKGYVQDFQTRGLLTEPQ